MRPRRHRRIAATGLAVVAAASIGACADQQGGAGGGEQTRTITVEIGRSAQSGDKGSGEPRAKQGKPPQVPGDESCEGAREPTTADNLRQAEKTIRCLTNAVRNQEGLSDLGYDERLARAAATRSKDMAEQNYFAHNGPDGGNVQRAVRRTGWIPEQKSWLLGENIGWAPQGRATPAQLMSAWLKSPTHRENILSKAYTEMGVGAIAGVPKKGAEPGATYTQVFGVTGRAARKAQT